MSSVGSLNSLPNLPREISLELGPMKERVLQMAEPKPLWKTGQDGILYASNRLNNMPSYVPRFSKMSNQASQKPFVLPTESEIIANLSPRQLNLRRLARPPTYRTRKKCITAQHRITAVSDSPRLCYSTRKKGKSVALSEKSKALDASIGDMKKIENECMGYAMMAKAKQIVKFRAQRRISLETAAARAEPFAIKRLNSYRPEPPSSDRLGRSNALLKVAKPKRKKPFRSLRIPVNQRQRNKGHEGIEDYTVWSASSEWVKYESTGNETEGAYVANECEWFDDYVASTKGLYSPRTTEAFEQEDKYAKGLLAEATDPSIKRIFKAYKPKFIDAPYRPTFLIKKASEVYAKRLVAGRVDSKPVEVTWKILDN